VTARRRRLYQTLLVSSAALLTIIAVVAAMAGGDITAIFTLKRQPASKDYENDWTRFADINGDGKAEIITIEADGNVWAYKNTNGLIDQPNNTYTVGGTLIAKGFTRL
jgi:hypothetical protein